MAILKRFHVRAMARTRLLATRAGKWHNASSLKDGRVAERSKAPVCKIGGNRLRKIELRR